MTWPEALRHLETRLRDCPTLREGSIVWNGRTLRAEPADADALPGFVDRCLAMRARYEEMCAQVDAAKAEQERDAVERLRRAGLVG